MGRWFHWEIWLDGPWEHVRALKGAVTANSFTETRERRRGLWQGARPLRVTIASDAMDESELTHRLLSLARLDDVEIFVGPDFPVTDLPNEVQVYEWRSPPQPLGGLRLDSTAIRVSNSTGWSEHGVLMDHDWRALARTFASADTPDEVAQRTFLELKASEGLESDIFVTRNPSLLAARFGSAWFHRHGVFSPREAVTTTEVLLRSRRQFVPHIDKTSRYTITGAFSFYGYVTEGKMPHLFIALRSCLAPQRVATMRPIAEQVAMLVPRYEDLLVASDELARLAQLEGQMSADNQIREDQLYHLQYALILIAGILDMLAWIVTLLEGPAPDRREISWRALVEGKKKWTRSLANSDAKACRDAAVTSCRRETADLAYELRDAIQHRQPIASSIVEVEGPSIALPPSRGPVHARINLIDLERCLDPVTRRADGDTPGLLEDSGRQYLVPHAFVRGLADKTAELVDEVMAVPAWPHAADWWGSSESVVEREQLVTRAMWLYG